MAGTESLLRMKLSRPAVKGRVLVRDRLLDHLSGCMTVPLTLVVAPAGYGKTTLLSQWSASVPFPTSWVCLNQLDNSPRVFWSYIRDALIQLYPILKDVESWPLENLAERHAIGNEILNRIAVDGTEAAIILDDFHRLHDTAALEELRAVLDGLAPNLHVIIAARSEPPFCVARQRVYGRILDLRAEDLRFTDAEAIAFLSEASGASLPPAELRALADRVDGWPAGLRLAADAERRHVADYVIREIFSRESGEIQSFMLQTAVLDRLCAPLCAAVIDQPGTSVAKAQSILEDLDRKGLLVPLDHERRWYRYQRLFAEAVRDRAGATDAFARRPEPAPKSSPQNEPILNARETEILRCVAEGMKNHVIATRLHLAERTVKWYLEQIYAKLDAHSRTQALAAARTLSLID